MQPDRPHSGLEGEGESKEGAALALCFDQVEQLGSETGVRIELERVAGLRFGQLVGLREKGADDVRAGRSLIRGQGAGDGNVALTGRGGHWASFRCGEEFLRDRVELKVNFKSSENSGEAMDEMTIGGVAQRAGLRASAIRYYEGIGILPAAKRTSGQRRYRPDVLDRLALIRFAQDAGFTMAEIKTLFEGFEDETPISERWQVLARRKLAEVEAAIARAERMKTLLGHALECRCLRVEDCAQIIGRGRP